MRLLDTDVMVDVLRGYAPAVEWLRMLGDEELGLPRLVAMELIAGCRDRNEATRVQELIAPFGLVWPTQADCGRALQRFPSAHLSHRLGVLDALIAECAVGAEASLCTFNHRHFAAVPSLKTERPYTRAPASDPSVPS